MVFQRPTAGSAAEAAPATSRAAGSSTVASRERVLRISPPGRKARPWQPGRRATLAQSPNPAYACVRSAVQQAGVVALGGLRFLRRGGRRGGGNARFARHLLHLTHGDLADPGGVGPHRILPGAVLLWIPVALVIELGAIDGDVLPTRAGDIDLDVAGEAGAAAGGVAACTAQGGRQARFGGLVAVGGVDLGADFHGTGAFGLAQRIPVA